VSGQRVVGAALVAARGPQAAAPMSADRSVSLQTAV